jgi:lipoate-protein ligase B
MRRELAIAELGLVEYERAHALQQALVAARSRDQIGDVLLLLEHTPVYTLGRGADEKFILTARSEVPIFRVSRGGQVTYHGPGQTVVYPILKLEGADRDVSRYLRNLEGVMIAALAHYGIAAERRDKLTGVWVGQRKIASIGIGIRRWVTYHGLALNVNPDLSYFHAIVPCGINGCEMTSVARLGFTDIRTADFAGDLAESFREVFGYTSATRVDTAELWSMVDRPEPATQAASTNEAH